MLREAAILFYDRLFVLAPERCSRDRCHARSPSSEFGAAGVTRLQVERQRDWIERVRGDRLHSVSHPDQKRAKMMTRMQEQQGMMQQIREMDERQ